MNSPVLVIGLDGADAHLVETWMAQGYLPNLARLQQTGLYGRLENLSYNTTETTWPTVWSGCLPSKTHYWSPAALKHGSYEIEDVGAYAFDAHPPFYALGNQRRVIAFDVPQTVFSDQVNGIQVLGWGGHAPYTPRRSHPPSLLSDLHKRHGKHPAFGRDYGDWWKSEYLTELKDNLKIGAARRAKICRELLTQEPWDLFVTVFSETHSASHDFWHLHDPAHPLHHHTLPGSSNPMLEVFQAVDQGIGEILDAVPDNTHVIVFSGVGMGCNATDVPSMLMMPELLYRFSFPGQSRLMSQPMGRSLPPVQAPKWRTWAGEVWRQTYEPNLFKRLLRYGLPGKYQPLLDRIFGNSSGLASPQALQQAGCALFWQPTLWYSPLWPQMKAFALPSFSEGYVRINLQGREPNGLVPYEQYDEICDQITQQLDQLRDARSGEAAVKEVIRVRRSPDDDAPSRVPADLVVVWAEHPMDVIDSPDYGRIGPTTYFRPGGHRARGFLLATGPGIQPRSTLSQGHAVDLAPTILNLLDVPIPSYYDGQPLLTTQSVQRN